MITTITTRQWATVKRVAQSVQPMVQKKENLYKKIQELAEEYKALAEQIDGFEHGIKAMCGGLSTEDLVVRKVTILTDKTDKDGRPLKKTSYEPSAIVTYNIENNNYIITVEDSAQTSIEQSLTPEETTIENPSSDNFSL